VQKIFPEDRLKLLGAPFETMSEQSFYDYVVSLYQPRDARGKAKEAEVKGKKRKAPTKLKLGIYELRFQTALGEKQCDLEFDKSLLISEEKIKTLCDTLFCSEKSIKDFLAKKKFIFSENKTCASGDSQVAQVEIVQIETKEAEANAN